MSALLADAPIQEPAQSATQDRNPTATIAELAKAWTQAKAAFDQAQQVFDQLEATAIARRPAWLRVWSQAQGQWIVPPGWPLVNPPPEVREAHEAWLIACEKVDQELGLEAANVAAQKALAAADAIADQIQRARPQTPGEAAIKLAVLLGRYGDGRQQIEDGRPFYAFLDDLFDLPWPPRNSDASGARTI